MKTLSSDKYNMDQIDTDLYSRQIATVGLDAMNIFIKRRILIWGLNSYGIEIAKNIILAGPQIVDIRDNNLLNEEDLSYNFAASVESVNRKTRAEASVSLLSTLNTNVSVSIQIDDSMELIGNYDIIIFCEGDYEKAVHINNLCRLTTPNKSFILVIGAGPYATVFTDFGRNHMCTDVDGEEPKSALIEGVTTGKVTTIFTYGDKQIFQTGEFVKFSEINGCNKLHDIDRAEITKCNKQSIIVNVDSSDMGKYINNGRIHQCKEPLQMEFFPLNVMETRLAPIDHSPTILDYSNPEDSQYIQICALATWKALGNRSVDKVAFKEIEAEAEKILLETTKNDPHINIKAISTAILTDYVSHWRTSFVPTSAFIGGIIAQEVFKTTGKYRPIYQWLNYSCREIIENNGQTIEIEKVGKRYRDQLKIIGHNQFENLRNAKLLLAGAGALGCEYLKAFALMGVASGPEGCIYVTDNDSIEISNLNRQFLFHKEHVGCEKSTVAAEAARKINPECKIVPMNLKLCVETENTFNDDFFESLDIVVNALDNVEARKYMDSRCVWFDRPLLEAGTQGTKANTQVIIPTITQTYSDSQDPPDDSIPLCTLKNFPYNVEHAIEWARDKFGALFTEIPQEIINLLSSPDNYFNRINTEVPSQLLVESITLINDCLDIGITRDYAKCIQFAFSIFLDFFDERIHSLINAFPEDHVNTDGTLFWSGPKRMPLRLSIDLSDPMTLQFIQSTANIIANCWNIPYQESIIEVQRIASTISPKEQVHISNQVLLKEDNDKNDVIKKLSQEDHDLIRKIAKSIREKSDQIKKTQTIQPIKFEKDCDTNYHIDFIHSCTNLRARNYRIEETDRMKAKIIAGKIIPAVATTTAAITGVALVEFIKTLTPDMYDISKLRNVYVNLGLSLFLFSEPMPPAKNISKEYDALVRGPLRAKPEGFTTWDKINIFIEDPTPKKIFDWLEKNMKATTYILSSGNACLYNDFIPQHKKTRQNLPIIELYESILKIKLTDQQKFMQLDTSCCDCDDSVDLILPTIKLQLK